MSYQTESRVGVEEVDDGEVGVRELHECTVFRRRPSNDVTSRLFEAVRSTDLKLAKELLESGETGDRTVLEELNEEGHTCLGIACVNGSLDIVVLLIENGANLNKSDFYGQTPLQYATEYGHVDLVRLLIQIGADVNYIEERLAALHIAACKGQAEITKILIQSKCDVNIRNKKGVCPLHCAVSNGHRDVMQLLLLANAETNVKGQTSDRTPLFMASEIGDEVMVQMLLSHGAKLNLVDQYGMTPLNVVCNRNISAIGQLFIQSGARVNVADKKGNLPLHYASRSGDADVVKLLLEHGSKVDVFNVNFDSPLHLAIRMQHSDVVKLLVTHGCSTNMCESASDGAMITPLFAAVTSYADPEEFEDVLTDLVAGDCDLDLVSQSTSTSSSTTVAYETALYRALDIDKNDVACVLLRHGADPYVECPHGITILNKACQRRMMSFIELLVTSSHRWRRESWLAVDRRNPTCIASRNLGRFADVPTDVPMVFWNKIGLYGRIQEALQRPFSLQQWCRIVVRTSVGGRKLYAKLRTLHLPKRLIEFLMLRSED